MSFSWFDVKSIRSYGVQGAIGLLMGAGAGSISYFFVSHIGSIIDFTSGIVYISVLYTAELAVLYVIFGAYAGYIFGGERSSSRLFKSGAIAGVFCGLAAGSIFSSGFIDRTTSFDELFITMPMAGLVYGFPKLKNMTFLAISGIIGSVTGQWVYVLGEKLTPYLSYNFLPRDSPVILSIAFLFYVLAFGLPGASIAIGMYFAEKTVYTAKEIPKYLKTMRYTGIILNLLTLLFYSFIMYVNIINHYGPNF